MTRYYFLCHGRLVLIRPCGVLCGVVRVASQPFCATVCRSTVDIHNPGWAYLNVRSHQTLFCIRRRPTSLRLAPALRGSYENRNSYSRVLWPTGNSDIAADKLASDCVCDQT